MSAINVNPAALLQEYQAAAIKWRKGLLSMPLVGMEKAIKEMTVRTGIRYKEMVGALSLGAELAPHKSSRVTTDKALEILYREAETFFGSLNLQFDPTSIIQTIHGADMEGKGPGMSKSEFAKLVLFQLAKDVSNGLYRNLWSAVRDGNGDTTATLFNGFDTITQTEITGGGLAAAKGNYVKLTEQLTAENAYDLLKDAIRQADESLLDEPVNIYTSYDIFNKYNDAYLATHAGIPYNGQFDQMRMEGVGGNAMFVPMGNKKDSKFIHVTPKKNMLICTDQLSDMENVFVGQYSPFLLNFVMTMFFGVQFESLDKRRMLVIELADAPANPGTNS